MVESVTDYAIFAISPSGTIVSWNAGGEQLFGYTREEVAGRNFDIVFTAEDRTAGAPQAELTEAEKMGRSANDRWHVRKDGSRFWATNTVQPIRDSGGTITGYTKIVRDGTERRTLEDSMRHQALHDDLTGLPNRALFFEHLKRTFAQAKRHGEANSAVFFIDVDNFKVVNDSLGHVVADGVLVALADRLSRLIREEDILARMGGDEFAILASYLHLPHEAEALAERIHLALADPFVIQGRELFVTASIGIALGNRNHEKPERALQDADIAMYAAKAQGRSSHMTYDRSMHERVVELQTLESELHQALARNEFEILYQPIVDLKTLRPTGLEALVRWRHPSRGLLLPREFIDVAERCGLLIELDRWVLLNACRRMSAWHERHANAEPLALCVNLSSQQFSRSDLVPFVRSVLDETKIDPAYLKFEITENALLERSERALATVAELGEVGIQVYIDDFGTGYSSLSYLCDLPVTMLKIDQSFVSKMTKTTNCAEIVRTIVEVGHNFKLEITAEGIETKEQLNGLTALGCEYGQGYLFAKPLAWDAAVALAGAPFTI